MFAAVCLVGLCRGSAALAEAEDTSASSYDDCTRIELDLEAAAGALTDEEKIALMDREFYESLARFDRCQASFSSDDGGGSDGGGSDGGGSDGGGSDGGQGGGVQSVPSASVSGTDPEKASEEEPKEGREPGTPAVQPATAEHSSTPRDNGKTPDDIPPANNDDIIARGLREVAENEKNPEEREKLWNEYRKYKNLPVKEAPSEERPAPKQSR